MILIHTSYSGKNWIHFLIIVFFGEISWNRKWVTSYVTIKFSRNACKNVKSILKIPLCKIALTCWSRAIRQDPKYSEDNHDSFYFSIESEIISLGFPCRRVLVGSYIRLHVFWSVEHLRGLSWRPVLVEIICLVGTLHCLLIYTKILICTPFMSCIFGTECWK